MRIETIAGKVLLACAAVSAPFLLTTASVPDAVFYNQLAALVGWGLWLAWDGSEARGRPAGGDRSAPLAATFALAVCMIFAAARIGLGQGAAVGILAASCVLLWRGARADNSDVHAFAVAWWIAGVASAAIAAVQYFTPALADGWLVAGNSTPGRAIGNVRQPNHLSSALLCSVAMTAWLWQARRLHAGWAAASLVAMIFALALTASRTGALSLAVLLCWALVDRRLPRGARWTLGLTPLLYLVFWAALAAYADSLHSHFYAAERLHTDSDISSSRFAIWRNALHLIAENPWLGVGWGNFNFAWTFSPFPDRPVAFFDHTHNLPLQLAVEIGLPATVAMLASLGWALWRARGAWHAPAADADPRSAAAAARASLAMLALLAVHSQLEYPLWYAYFLLPAAWALGLFLGASPPSGREGAPAGLRAGSPDGALASPAGWSAESALGRPETGASLRQLPRQFATTPLSRLLLRFLGILMLLGAVYAAWDHRRIEVIFAPPAGSASLDARIAEGQRSWLFGHHADYAAVTTEPRDTALAPFRRPLHQLVDVRLLATYMEVLYADGRVVEALYAAQRLREFRRDDAQAYFERCTPEEPAPPWLCETRPVLLDWRGLDP